MYVKWVLRGLKAMKNSKFLISESLKESTITILHSTNTLMTTTMSYITGPNMGFIGASFV